MKENEILGEEKLKISMKPTYSASNNSLARNMEETVKQIFKQFN